MSHRLAPIGTVFVYKLINIAIRSEANHTYAGKLNYQQNTFQSNPHQSCLFMAHFNIQISLTTRSSKTSFTFRFPDQNFVRNSDLHDACYLVVLNISTEQTSTQIYSTGSQLGYQLLEPPTWLPTVSIMSSNIF